MAEHEIELDPVDFVTVGTIGPKGRRQFHLQAGRDEQVVSLVIEKEQARALAETLTEMLDELNRTGVASGNDIPDMNKNNMDLRDPVTPLFRVGQIGLGYDNTRDLVVMVAQEVQLQVLDQGEDEDESPLGNLLNTSTDDDDNDDDDDPEGNILRIWATRQQMRALCLHTLNVVRQGRVNPQSNGRLLYYWT